LIVKAINLSEILHKYPMRKFILIRILGFSFFSLISFQLFSQSASLQTSISVIPTITVGYTFGSGFNFGGKVSVEAFQLTQQTMETYAGLSLSLYMVNFRGAVHRIKTINIELSSKYFTLGIGAGDISKRWGIKKINSDKAFGMSFDMNVYTYSPHSPWIGYKFFKPREGTWVWSDRGRYNSFYTFFMQPKIQPYN